MPHLFWYWLTAILVLAILWRPFVKGGLAYVWYFLLVCADVAKDLACQLYLDVSKIWKRPRKPPELDLTEDFHHRDC
jgi:hypothetical protein